MLNFFQVKSDLHSATFKNTHFTGQHTQHRNIDGSCMLAWIQQHVLHASNMTLLPCFLQDLAHPSEGEAVSWLFVFSNMRRMLCKSLGLALKMSSAYCRVCAITISEVFICRMPCKLRKSGCACAHAYELSMLFHVVLF